MSQPTQQDIESWLWESANILRGPVDPANLRDFVFPNTVGKLGDEKSDRLAFKNLLLSAGVPDCQLYQLRKTAFTNMASQTDLKTLMEFSGHTQVTTVMKSYVHTTTESMAAAIQKPEGSRPQLKQSTSQM